MTWAVGCVLVLFLISAGLRSVEGSGTDLQAEADSGVSQEEYEIYSTVIKQYYLRPDTKLIMIEERTFRYDFAVDEEPWREKKKGVIIDASAADDYELKNGQQWLLNKDSFKLTVKAALITDNDLKAIFHGKWGDLEWINYYRRFPDSRGFVMLSRIGFNTERTQGLMYVGSRCGPGCGDRYFLLLQKENGSWITKKELRKKEFG
jgi:hypothetical protein